VSHSSAGLARLAIRNALHDSRRITQFECPILSEIASVLVCFDHVALFIVNANHSVPIRLAVGQIFSKLCAYENDNSPIKKLNEPLAFATPFAPHPTRARLLCAFADGPSR